jgi:hypothetical protein
MARRRRNESTPEEIAAAVKLITDMEAEEEAQRKARAARQEQIKLGLRMSEAEWRGFHALSAEEEFYQDEGMSSPQAKFLYAIQKAADLHSEYGLDVCERLRTAILHQFGVVE